MLYIKIQFDIFILINNSNKCVNGINVSVIINNKHTKYISFKYKNGQNSDVIINVNYINYII